VAVRGVVQATHAFPVVAGVAEGRRIDGLGGVAVAVGGVGGCAEERFALVIHSPHRAEVVVEVVGVVAGGRVRPVDVPVPADVGPLQRPRARLLAQHIPAEPPVEHRLRPADGPAVPLLVPAVSVRGVPLAGEVLYRRKAMAAGVHRWFTPVLGYMVPPVRARHNTLRGVGRQAKSMDIRRRDVEFVRS